jgi:hypothetical protein
VRDEVLQAKGVRCLPWVTAETLGPEKSLDLSRSRGAEGDQSRGLLCLATLDSSTEPADDAGGVSSGAIPV